MKKFLTLTLISTLILVSCGSMKSKMNIEKTSKKEELKAFPKAENGYVQQVLLLPELSDKEESDRKVEIIAGKILLVDCNIQHLSGKIEQKTVKGLGYDYYQFNTKGELLSTLMLCPEEKKTEKFVSAPSVMVNYNSKLPVVVYTPKGYEVRYKIWKAGKLQQLQSDSQ